MASITETKKNMTKTRKEVKKSLGQVHDTVLTTTDEFVDGLIVTGEKWQKLFAKALKNSKPILNKQIDILFDGIETLQVQVKDGNKRIKKLTGVDPQKVAGQVEDKVREETDKIISLVSRTAQKAEDTATEAFKTVETKTKTTAKKAKKTTSKVQSKAKKVQSKAKKTTVKAKRKVRKAVKKAS